MLESHKVTIWAVVFAVHFLAHAAGVLRSLRRVGVPGVGLGALSVAGSLGAGIALGVTALSLIAGWHGGHG